MSAIATGRAPTPGRAQAALLVTSWVGLSLGVIIVMSSTFSVLFGPISSELGWDRAQLSLAYSLFSLTSTLAMPAIGRFVDTAGARAVIITCATVFAIVTFFLRFATELWQFYALFILLGVFSGGTSTLPYFKVLVAAFAARRGMALGIANSGTAAGTFLFPFISFHLNAAVGWRNAYLVMGLGVAVITAAVVLLGFRARVVEATTSAKTAARAGGVAGTVAAGEATGAAAAASATTATAPTRSAASSLDDSLTLTEAMRTPAFWLVGISFFMATTALVGFLIHVVPLLTDRAMPAQTAALAASVFGAAQVIGRVGAGFALDRFRSGAVVATLWLLAAGSFAALWSGVAGFTLFACTAIMGLAFGGEGDVLAYVVGKLFGAKSFGRIYSVLLMINLLGGVAGPYFFGLGFEATGSYTLILGSAAICMALASALVLTVRIARDHATPQAITGSTLRER